MKLLEFFQDDNGRLSSMRLYCFIALLIASVLSFKQPTDFSLIVTWLTAAFAPKSVQKAIERLK